MKFIPQMFLKAELHKADFGEPTLISIEDAARVANQELERWKESLQNDEPYLSVQCMREALQWCDEMLTARDEMNAKVHCAPLRLSPITERVKQAIALYDDSKLLGEK